MLSRLYRLVVVLLLIIAVGAHWTLLQSVAWVSMAVSFSQDSTVKDALTKTFDGQHPCAICKLVKDGKSAEQKEQAQKPLNKIDLMTVSLPSALVHPAMPAVASAKASSYLPPIESPFLPPPRTV